MAQGGGLLLTDQDREAAEREGGVAGNMVLDEASALHIAVLELPILERLGAEIAAEAV